MPLDANLCLKQNIHGRSEADIRKAINRWIPTPSNFTQLKYDSLFADQMEDISDDEVAEDNSLDAVSDDEASAVDDAKNEDISSEDEEAFNEVSRLATNKRCHFSIFHYHFHRFSVIFPIFRCNTSLNSNLIRFIFRVFR